MKMTKIFGAVLLMASTLMFTSCEETVEDILGDKGPTLVFKAKEGYATGDATVKVGEEVKFSWEVTAVLAKLESFTIRMDNQDVDGFPNEKVDRNEYEDEYTTSFDEAGEYTLVFIAKDKDGETTSVTVKITVEGAAEENLADAIDFDWVRDGGKAATGLDVYGLSWTSNTSTSAVIKKGADKLVVLTKEEWASITTKAALKAAVDNGTDTEKWEAVSVTANDDYDEVIATKKEDAYFLIHVTKGTVVTNADKSVKITIEGQSKQ